MATRLDVHESHATAVVPRTPSLSRQVAAAVVKLAQRFHSDILLNAGALHIDAKSTLMALILLNALKGEVVELTARGKDSRSAVRHLSALFHHQEELWKR
jgi:phosphotransferase system HPr (HPr) family protein